MTLDTMQNSKHLETSITIDASAEEVWSAFSDFNNWESWNPFIIESLGHAVEGTRLKNTMLNGDKTMVFKPKIIKVEENKELIWKGHLIIPGLFDGRHGFRIEVVNDQKVRFINYEDFSGILSGIILKKIGKETEINFDKMNQALKKEVESKR